MLSFIDKYLSKEWKEYLNIHKELKAYKKNEIIFHAGEEGHGLYVILSGKVKVSYLQFNGSERLIRLATSGELLGHRAFGGNWEYPISALVLEDVEVLYIPLKVFETMVKADANFSFHMMMFFAEELRKSEAKIKHYPVKNLVARAVLDNYRAFGFVEESDSKIDHTLSRRDYASMAGTTYETVVRSLAQMKKDQIIDFEGKSIHILDLDKLQNLAHPPYKKAKK